MRTASIRVLALASLASLAMATSAGAANILSFGVGGPGTKTAVSSLGFTSLLTNSPTLPGAFPVNITTIGDVVLPPILTIAARESFVGVLSNNAPATNVGGTISQPFRGEIRYQDPTNPAINYLTIQFVGVLRGTAGGFTASLSADNSVAGQSVTFTSTDPRVIPFLADPFRNFEIGLTGLTSGLAIVGNTIAPFTTSNQSGNVSSFIPEPSSVVMAGTAALAGLGCFGWRRRSKSL